VQSCEGVSELPGKTYLSSREAHATKRSQATSDPSRLLHPPRRIRNDSCLYERESRIKNPEEVHAKQHKVRHPRAGGGPELAGITGFEAFAGIVHVGVYTPSNETELGTLGARIYFGNVGMEALGRRHLGLSSPCGNRSVPLPAPR